MGLHHALGASGRAGGVDQEGQVAGPDGDRRWRAAGRLGALGQLQQRIEAGRDGGLAARGVHEHCVGLDLIAYLGEPRRRVAGIEHHRGPAHPEGAERGRDQRRVVAHQESHSPDRPVAALQERPRQAVGRAVELGEARLPRRARDGGLAGPQGRLLGEPLRDRALHAHR
jgi:hypothetical protein